MLRSCAAEFDALGVAMLESNHIIARIYMFVIDIVSYHWLFG